MRQTRRLREAAGSVLAAVLLAAVATAAVGGLSPARLAAQQQHPPQQHQLRAGTFPPATFEGYFARVHTDPAAVGERMRLDGMGARVLQPLAAPIGGAGDRPSFLDRVALGGFVTYAPDDDRGITAWHYGAQTDVSLLSRPAASLRIEPLFSLGVGAFSARRSGIPDGAFRADCRIRPADLPLVVGDRDDPCDDATGRSLGTHLAISPALAARAWLLPDVALRADAREVFVGGRRGVFELAVGLSFAR